MTETSGRWRRVEWGLLLLIVILGAALRFYQLSSLPPGLYTDEAYYALDAVDVLGGARPIYFPANNGREPLFIYVLAVSIGLLGRTPLAVRLPAAVFGTLTLPAVYLLGRALFGRRVGLLAAGLTAGTFWAVALSRIGLRATTLPALSALMLACTVYGWKTRRRGVLIGAGALCGLCFYTYLSARLIPVPLMGFGIFWYSGRRLRGEKPAIPVADLAAFLLPLVLIVTPLALYALREPQIYLGRVEQVSIFGGGLAQGGAALWQNLVALLGAFTQQGDLNARHNLPGRPVFDPLLGAAFWLGAGLCLYRAWRRGDGAAALALWWAGTMLAPTVLSQDAPHFLRAIGALPMVGVFPALALDAAWSRLRAGWPQALAASLAVGLVVINAARTTVDYFGPYAHDPNTGLFFQAATVDLAQSANQYLTTPDHPVYLDRRLWDSFAAVRFLLQPSPALHVFAVGAPPAPPAAEARIFVWPYGTDPGAALSPARVPAQVAAEAGALYRNDREPAPYPLYAQYTVSPLPAKPSAPVAVFEQAASAGGIVLRSADVVSSATEVRVTLTWSVEQRVAGEVHVFIHWRAGDEIVAQADGPLGGDLYPASTWRTGDWVVRTDDLTLPVGGAAPDQLVVGLYTFPAGERLKVRATGQEVVALDWRRP